MPARVKVRAVIWVDGGVVVHRERRRGVRYVTLPGGRVGERESAIDALRREVLEEVGLEIEIGDLLCAAEVVSGARHQDVELLFEAWPRGALDQGRLDLVDPADADAEDLLPPVLAELARRRDPAGVDGPRWLGNVYRARGAST